MKKEDKELRKKKYGERISETNKMKKLIFYIFTTIVLSSLLQSNTNDCKCKNIELKGRVKVVTSFTDFKVKGVNSFPDLRVKKVKQFPNIIWRELKLTET